MFIAYFLNFISDSSYQVTVSMTLNKIERKNRIHKANLKHGQESYEDNDDDASN